MDVLLTGANGFIGSDEAETITRSSNSRILPKGGCQPREGLIADVYAAQGGKIVQMQAYSDSEEARRAVGLPSHH